MEQIWNAWRQKQPQKWGPYEKKNPMMTFNDLQKEDVWTNLMGWKNLEPIESEMTWVSPNKKWLKNHRKSVKNCTSMDFLVHFVDRHWNWVMENGDVGWLVDLLNSEYRCDRDSYGLWYINMDYYNPMNHPKCDSKIAKSWLMKWEWNGYGLQTILLLSFLQVWPYFTMLPVLDPLLWYRKTWKKPNRKLWHQCSRNISTWGEGTYLVYNDVHIV